MKKVLFLILGLTLFPTIVQAACADKLIHCKGGGLILVNQKWNWGKARCMPCDGSCRYNYGQALAFCSDKGGIDRLADLSERAVLEKVDAVIKKSEADMKNKKEIYDRAYKEMYQKCERHNLMEGERGTQLNCVSAATNTAKKESGL